MMLRNYQKVANKLRRSFIQLKKSSVSIQHENRRFGIAKETVILIMETVRALNNTIAEPKFKNH